MSNTGDCVTPFPCSLGTISAGTTRTIVATFTVPQSTAVPGSISNTASVTTSATDSVPANNTATATTEIRRPRVGCDVNGDGLGRTGDRSGTGRRTARERLDTGDRRRDEPRELLCLPSLVRRRRVRRMRGPRRRWTRGHRDRRRSGRRRTSAPSAWRPALPSKLPASLPTTRHLMAASASLRLTSTATAVPRSSRAPGPGGGPHVRVFRLVGGTPVEIADFNAYDPAFTGGVFVAAGDVTGDGRAAIITGTYQSGGPVRVFTLGPGGVTEHIELLRLLLQIFGRGSRRHRRHQRRRCGRDHHRRGTWRRSARARGRCRRRRADRLREFLRLRPALLRHRPCRSRSGRMRRRVRGQRRRERRWRR